MRYFLGRYFLQHSLKVSRSLFGQNDKAILVPLAVPHQKHAAFSINVVRFEMGDLLRAEPGAVAEHEGRPILQTGRRPDDGLDLVRTEDLGQAHALARLGEMRVVPVLTVEDLVEQPAQRVGGDPHRRVGLASRRDVSLIRDDVGPAGGGNRSIAKELRESLEHVFVVDDGAGRPALRTEILRIAAYERGNFRCHVFLQSRGMVRCDLEEACSSRQRLANAPPRSG
jgi:hypothetical protein